MKLPDSFNSDTLLDIRQALENIAYSLCEIIEARFRPGTCRADERGYIILTETQSQTEVRIPFHFADFFPTGDVLRSLLEVARHAKTSDIGTICISGSATYFEALNRLISDLDFCEYSPENGNKLRENLEAKNRQSHDDLISLGLLTKCLPGKTSAEYTAHQPIAVDEHFDYAQIRFLGRFALSNDEVDVLEITNLVLPINPGNPDPEMLSKTFCMQEVPIGEWIPQRLLEPIDIKRYANFLFGEAQNYLKRSNYVKAAKRALPLSRILFLDEEGNTIIDAIQPACNHVTLLSRRKLLEQVGDIERPIVDDLRTRIDALNDRCITEPDYATIKDAVSILLDKVDELQSSTITI